MSCVWERGHIACNTWKTKMKNLLGTDSSTYNTEFPRLNWTESFSANRLAEMRSLLECEQFLTQYFLARKAKNGGASRNERHKERAFLDILEPGCNKDRTRDSSLSLASQWYIEHGNHLHLIIITSWWQTFELAFLSISWSSLQLRLIGLRSDHRFADGSSNSPTETEN